MAFVLTAFTILEQFCVTAKGAPANNEDRLVINDGFVAVIDGATASKPIGGQSGGAVAAELVADAFSVLEAEANARDLVDLATEMLARRIGCWPDVTAMRPSAAFVGYSAARREIWRVGDCHFRLDDREFSGEKEIDRIAYAFRSAIVRARLTFGLSTTQEERRVAPLAQPHRPLVEIQHAFCNVETNDPLAYGAIDGRFVPDRLIEVFDAAPAKEIVLCSDGFFRPFATLAEGLEDVARLRDEDPLVAFLRNGSRPFPPGGAYFDDTTYVRLRVRG